MRILLTRTDRVGDVVLSTPVIKAIRDKYPDAYIAFMVRPYAEDIVKGNPYLDEVITYDKYGRHKNIFNTINFALKLRNRRFDKAIMLHPTNRVHLISYLAGIPQRIGYDRKLSFLLTEKIPHTKQEGKKHEVEYTIELLKPLGIACSHPELYVAVSKGDLKKIEKIFIENNIKEDTTRVCINPGASCPSKRWPVKNFISLGRMLIEELHTQIIVVSDNENKRFADTIAYSIKGPLLNLSGKTSIGELSAVISKCKLFVSNDSGPVHIACALKIPTISIFGRRDPGLSPARWRPFYNKAMFFHKDIGCDICRAHNCSIGFKCLKAITVEEVFLGCKRLLESNLTK